ncbi:hypothetical protein [Paenibacillus sp. FSL H7-0714]|uniref:hypothetical protein n=1 Tax=Paenibacillus sp. FSL H7-0714 TaxID=2954735 RepID=UPI0030F5CE7C
MRYNFDGKGLTETPEVVFESNPLLELSMYNNHLKEIPDQLFLHDELEVLNYAE